MPFVLNPIAFVIPAFFLFLGLEYYVTKQRKQEVLFNYEGSIANLSVGIAERLLNLLITGSFYSLYDYVYEHFSVFNLPSSWWMWAILLLATDFVWYWYHRLGHEVNLFWGAHIVHHQSEEFNYTVSARITTLQAIVRNVFWIILPFIGFHPNMVITILVVHGAYSFFTHTQEIGKLGWAEYIFITPSHHGVHHASNEKYLDKNYGDIFVFWDKLFGTFQAEEEKPKYGLTHSLASKSFLWQHFHYYAELMEACRRTRSVVKSIKLLVSKPNTLDPNIRPFLERKWFPNKVTYRSSTLFKPYLNGQLVLCSLLLFGFTLTLNSLSNADKVFCIFFILITLVNCGALLEQQRWVYQLEVCRIISLLAYTSYLWNSVWLFATSIIVIAILSMLDSIKARYLRLLYHPEDLIA